MPLGGVAEIEAALAAAERAFPRVRGMAGHERAALLLRIAAGIGARQADFVATIVSEAESRWSQRRPRWRGRR